jgi:hypothetical protein
LASEKERLAWVLASLRMDTQMETIEIEKIETRIITEIIINKLYTNTNSNSTDKVPRQ